MPIYNVKIWYTTYVIREIEANDPEEAEYKAIGDTLSAEDQVMENLEAMEFNNEVTLCDNQYSDQQELEDREKDL